MDAIKTAEIYFHLVFQIYHFAARFLYVSLSILCMLYCYSKTKNRQRILLVSSRAEKKAEKKNKKVVKNKNAWSRPMMILCDLFYFSCKNSSNFHGTKNSLFLMYCQMHIEWNQYLQSLRYYSHRQGAQLLDFKQKQKVYQTMKNKTFFFFFANATDFYVV